MKIHKLTFLLFLVVLGTLGFTFASRTQNSDRKVNDTQARKQLDEKKGRFPIADYDEPELSDPQRNEARKEKKLRHNNFKMVAKNPPDWQAELLVISEGAMDFAAFPVAESKFVLLGEVKAAEAHVSENKKNVYSEFKVSVARVFKTATSSIIQGSEITVDRVGGFVRYPNGRTVLYRLTGENMPIVGGKYVFFLTSSNNQDLKILTAYQVGPSGVVPLDDSPQFEQFRGMNEEVFLQSLSDSLAKSSPY